MLLCQCVIVLDCMVILHVKRIYPLSKAHKFFFSLMEKKYQNSYQYFQVLFLILFSFLYVALVHVTSSCYVHLSWMKCKEIIGGEGGWYFHVGKFFETFPVVLPSFSILLLRPSLLSLLPYGPAFGTCGQSCPLCH